MRDQLGKSEYKDELDLTISRQHRLVSPAVIIVTIAMFPLLAPAREDQRPIGNVLIDIRPQPTAAEWIACGFEQNIAREIMGYQRINVVDKRDVGTRACEPLDTGCRLSEYAQAGIDIVMIGKLFTDRMHYELFETWTPSKVTQGSFRLDVNTSPIRLKQQILSAFNPFLIKGGLLDQKTYLARRRLFQPTSIGSVDTSPSDPHRRQTLGLTFAAISVFFAFPFLLAALGLGWKRLGRLARLRTFRWLTPLILVQVVLALHGLTDLWTDLWKILDPDSRLVLNLQTLWSGLASWEWLIGIVGGLAWGWLLLVTLRAAFPSIGGLDRIGHRDVLRLIAAWFNVCVQRLALLTAFYTPFVLLFWWAVPFFGPYQRMAIVILAPISGLLLRAWFLAWVEILSLYLDENLVDGLATSENPWHREVEKYFNGYLHRTGWAVEAKLLDRILFLPGKTDGVMCYGGGLTHPRILISTKLLHLAIGAPEEIPQDSQVVPWAEGLAGSVVPQEGPLPPRLRPSTTMRVLKALGRVLGLRAASSARRTFKRRHSQSGRSSRRSRRKTVGQAATSLGYVLPFPPGELVPLIADDTEDFEIVRELLAEHYAWFEPDPDDEYDDTDPTDRDFLFGALVREIGVVQRQDSQLLTLVRGVEHRLQDGFSWLRKLEQMASGIYQRLWARSPVILADGYVALNLARHHLIQYLFYVGWNRSDLLTERADVPELHRTSKKIFSLVSAEPPGIRDRQYGRATVRSRLVWLSQFFASSLTEKKRTRIRMLLVLILVLVATLSTALLIKQALDYHSVYTQRLLEQEQKIEESRRKQLRETKEQSRHGEKK